MDRPLKDQMSPDASPSQLSTKSGVRRVNNRPVFIVLGALTVFLLIMVLVASDRAASQHRTNTKAAVVKEGSTAMFANEIAGGRRDGIIQANNAGTPALPNLPAVSGSIAIARPENLDVPPSPPGRLNEPLTPVPMSSQGMRTSRDEEAERIRIMKIQQLDDAVRARTSVQIFAQRNSGSSAGVTTPGTQDAAPGSRGDTVAKLAALRQHIEASNRDDPTGAYMARLQQLHSLGLPAGADGAERDGLKDPAKWTSQVSRNDIGQFSGSGQGDRWRLDAQPAAPRTAFELRAGFVIPATLISGINSELPGQIVAQISQDVYDTPTGRHKLIPQGARLVGSYSAELVYGQSRLLIAWQRIVFPDGKTMDIGAMPGADGAGFSGFKDQVNNHFLRLLSSAFLMSAVTAGIAISQPEQHNLNTRPSTSGAMSEALGQQLGQVTAQLIAKNLNIAPTLQIRPGFRFNVIVTKDLTFTKPYAAFDY